MEKLVSALQARQKTLSPLEPLLLSLEQAAQLLNISTKTAKRMLSEGTLPGTRRIRRRVMISRADLERWIEKGCPQVAPAPGGRRRNG
jgi:excisionase family DNA binding protein